MRRLARDRRGVAAVEFGLLGSGLVVLMLGFADAVHLGRGHLRVHSAAAQVGQIVSQCDRVSGGDKGDEGEFRALAESILGTFARGGWSIVITAVGRDAQDRPFTWSMPETPPAPVAGRSMGAEMPPGLTLKPNQVIFRTEVFAPIKTAFLLRDSEAFATALHATRAASAAGLKSKAAGGPDCMKEDS